jgi:two-component system chemotaxis response regulator CheY
MQLSGSNPAASTKRSILLVDDDEPMRLAMCAVLSPRYRVTLAVDGLDGLDKASANPRPDLIVADIIMPRLDGISMVRRIRERDAMRRVPVIFLSGQMSVGHILAGLSVVPFGYLSKPIDPEALVRKVKSAFGDR